MISEQLKSRLRQQNSKITSNSDLVEEVIDKNCYRILPSEIEGRNVLDVGANIGCFSVLAASLGAKRVISFEPNIDNFRNLCLNSFEFENIHPLRFAVYNGLSETCNMQNVGDKCNIDSPNGNIPVVTLLQAVSLFPSSDDNLVLKMDIEGAEFDALYYAGNTIRRFKTISMEVHPTEKVRKLNHHTTCMQTFHSFMEFLNYKILFCEPMFYWTWDVEGNVVSCTLMHEIIKFERI
jgi:FkbM family methyltransferase